MTRPYDLGKILWSGVAIVGLIVYCRQPRDNEHCSLPASTRQRQEEPEPEREEDYREPEQIKIELRLQEGKVQEIWIKAESRPTDCGRNPEQECYPADGGGWWVRIKNNNDEPAEENLPEEKGEEP
ncbi:MAG: hypothetical protein HYV42_03480 [Candidatus Magasanikbacteria bacterium]|nr:hypothetical protein [Candidatus Magasanikbacteria bacterium]